MSSEEEEEGVDSDIWTEYGGEMGEDRTGKDRVYTKAGEIKTPINHRDFPFFAFSGTKNEHQFCFCA